MELNELRASDVMVPRKQIVAIDQNSSVNQLREFLGKTAHSRIPLIDGDMDHVVGYVAVRDAFTHGADATTLSALRRPVTFVPDSMTAIDVLQTFQARGVQIAMVVDEHGGTAGLLTREDLAEELLGQVATGVAKEGTADIERQADGSAIVAGTTSIRDVNRTLDLDLPESDDWTTLAGLCVGTAGRIPTKGERIHVGPTLLEIVDASPRRVRAVRISVARKRERG
jgi:putative hemolysin